MRIDIITIFPEYFGPLSVSLIGKAADRGDITFGVHDLRRWTHDVHHTVDDTPFGGGPGMVMKPEPWGAALDAVAGQGQDPLLIVPTPSGVPFTQQHAVAYAAEPWLIFGCGRYERAVIGASFLATAARTEPFHVGPPDCYNRVWTKVTIRRK